MKWAYSLLFCEKLFSRLHFSSELTSCRHWRLAWGNWNAMWHFVYKLFYWRLSVVEAMTEWLHEAWDVHLCLFHFKTSKEEGMIVLTRASIWTEAFIQWSVSPHERAPKRHLLFEFPDKMDRIWKMRLCFLSKVTIYKTGSFQWSSTCAVVKLVFVRYTCIPNQKTHTENFRYEYVYRYTPIWEYAIPCTVLFY